MANFDARVYSAHGEGPYPTAPAVPTDTARDPEVGHHHTTTLAHPTRSNQKESGTGIRILFFVLAVVIAVFVGIGVKRGLGQRADDDEPAISSQGETQVLSRAFDFAPDAPNPACRFKDNDMFVIENISGAERLKLRAIINEQDESVTIQAERQGNGWIGISINESSGMVPNSAVVGTPADGLAEMYFLGGKSRTVIEKAGLQTSISDAVTLQEDERTIVSFTVGLNGFDGASVRPGAPTRIMWAVGNDGDTSFEGAHAFDSRGFATIEISSCDLDVQANGSQQADGITESAGQDDEEGNPDLQIVAQGGDAVAFTFAPDSPYIDCQFDEFDTITNGDGQERLKIRAILNEAAETITIQAERTGDGWIGISINDSQGMVPNIAAIGTPADGKVEKYSLGGKSRPQITELEANEQTLEFSGTMGQDGFTVVSFTMPLADVGSPATTTGGPTRIMWAIGADGDTTFSGAHPFDSRGFATVNLKSCGLATPTSFSPTKAPSSAPVTAAPVAQVPAVAETLVFDFVGDAGEEDVVQFQSENKVYSKIGNYRSCEANVCPGVLWEIPPNGDGCSCSSNGLDTCYSSKDPVTIESYNKITYTETWDGSGKYTMSAAGVDTSFGKGGDHVSADTCYNDWRRGGFKVDLTGTQWGFHGDSKIWVGGYSPSMKIWADDQVVEMHEDSDDATISWSVPRGTRSLEVVCGGWPADCWSELSAFKSDAWD